MVYRGRGKARLAAIGLAAMTLPFPLAAAANPELTALVEGIDSEENARTALRIGTMDIAVRVHGDIAETIVTARFDNPTKERLEGRFTLAMPTGSVVTGYGLDVGGRMIDGVLVDQIEARRAYEARLRERIDPGLGEVSRGFEFKTRVYPIEAGSSRTVRVRFVTPLDPRRGYELPLSRADEVGRLSLSVEASGTASPPRLSLPGIATPEWRRDGDSHLFVHSAGNVRLDGMLAVAPPRRAAPLLVGRDSVGEAYFELLDSGEGSGGRAPRPASVAILWDRSLSRADDDLEAEIGLLRDYLDRVEPEAIELILFDSGTAERVRLATARAVAERLRRVTYRGATSFAGLAGKGIEAETCLIFTDGLVTLGSRRLPRLGCPLTAVSSARDADRPWLGALARAAGGEALHLDAGNRAELLTRLTRRVARVADVRSTSGAPVDYALLDAPAGGWRIVGPMPRTGGIVVRLAGLSSGPSERTYSPGPATSWSGAEGLWAADRLAVRAAGEEEDRETLIGFARRHSVAGPDISFLVLETPEDYAESRIEPPATLPAELRARYDGLVAERKENEEEEKRERFDTLLERWEEQKKWWNTRFDPNAKAGPDELDEGDQPVPAPLPPPPPAPYVAPPPEGFQPGTAPAPVATPDQGAINVSGSRIPQEGLTSTSPVTVVTATDLLSQGTTRTEDLINSLPQVKATGAKPPATTVTGEQEAEAAETLWSPDRPYLTALKAARGADRERVLAEQQRIHGALPAFWLDVSEYYHRSGQRDEALRLLLSALELPTRDSETLGLVAERLIRWGDIERGIALYERMVAMDRDHPHPRRGLALALAKRAASKPRDAAKADLSRAIALLSELVLTVDDDEYEGFDIVSLTELNAMIAQYRRLGGTDVPLDPRLIADLDLDLRIVVEWKNENLDVDMYLREPNGELASYYNDDTRIGGRLSPETTDGSGPEQYLLRRAANGTYVLKAEIYSEDALNPNGSARVIARLIRDFGRPGQREEMVEVELLPEREGDDDEDGEDGEDEDRVPVARIRIRR